MGDRLTDLIIHPTRLRIIQHLLLHQPCTAKGIAGALPDIPQASLYRHIRRLYDGGVLLVENERQVRGTVERSYILTDRLKEGNDSLESARRMVRGVLISLLGDFERYFDAGGCDPKRDMVLLNTCVLALTDEEFSALLRDWTERLAPLTDNAMTGERKPRRVTIISAPRREDSKAPGLHTEKTQGEKSHAED